jgi:polyisoprenoid-binding protein YceI
VTFPRGTFRLGPDHGRLFVKTGRTGAAAKAGHNLVLDVTAWSATLVVADDPAGTSLRVEADGASLRVREGHGGMQALGEDDKASIVQSIDEDVLKRQGVTFLSTGARPTADGRGLRFEGDLTLVGRTRPIAFEVRVDDDGALTGGCHVKQTDWGIKPYSTLFGALKVVDEVEALVEAVLPTGS